MLHVSGDFSVFLKRELGLGKYRGNDVDVLRWARPEGKRWRHLDKTSYLAGCVASVYE
jgi:hypothetical protein